jgi:hypothetical protein
MLEIVIELKHITHRQIVLYLIRLYGGIKSTSIVDLNKIRWANCNQKKRGQLMQLLDAIIAFALTMAAFATVVTVIVKAGLRIARMRKTNLIGLMKGFGEPTWKIPDQR